MSRKAREKSSTGIYHVMLRGINKQIIFEENEDYEKFIGVIEEYKEVCGYEIYAFCLMSNHIHLLIKEGKEELGIVFRRIGSKFVYWYNLKYRRSGHLFQDRFKSEVVEDDKYFLSALRYIHQNPIKAGIVDNITNYPWSSYKEYFGEKGICETEFALSQFSDDGKKAMELFEEFNYFENDDKHLEYERQIRINDEEAKKIIFEVAEVKDTKQIQGFEKERRNRVIRELKNKGLSIRQVERLTGISFGVIRNI